MIKRLLVGILFIVGFAVLGFFLGGHALNALYGGVNIEWQPLSLPSGHQPERFASREGPYVVVETNEGIQFAQLLRAGDPFPWERMGAEALPGDPFYTHASATCEPHPLEITGRWMQAPPGTIKAYQLCNYMRHAEYTGEFHYVILQDGSLWRWVFINPGMAGLGLFVYYVGRGLLGGAAFGLATFLGLLVLLRAMRRADIPDVEPAYRTTYRVRASGVRDKTAAARASQRSHVSNLRFVNLLNLILVLIVLLIVLWLTLGPLLEIAFKGL